MEKSKESIEAFTAREAKEWAEFISYRLAKELANQKKITVSRAEIFNIQNAVVLAAKQNLQEVGFAFADAGRYIDMKNISYSGSGDATKGAAFIEALKDWVRRQGTASFKQVPGYDQTAIRLDDEKAIQRIALGIFFHKMTDSNHKRKKWWSHILYGGLKNLYGRLLYGYGLEAINSIKQIKS
ncbi:hypothetical protein [Chondrinema litorale]|uniref:hypothetical protein n=1 Tax=Chondrinema litorale TaxID=2994555 RepID=UPI002542B859|nr:hypothetical protein [Chondrinema litorale]UZR93127.1 hypothetical protein OQ292_14805 [Chondrinema litorale]